MGFVNSSLKASLMGNYCKIQPAFTPWILQIWTQMKRKVKNVNILFSSLKENGCNLISFDQIWSVLNN
jgi:hypothetical protein